jgi:hypothetical protein
MLTILRDIVEEYGAIVSINGCHSLEESPSLPPPRFDEYEIFFERGMVTVSVDQEDDSLHIFSRQSELPYKYFVASTEPWKRVVGSPIMWTWILQNHAGYKDGFQFECRTPSGYVLIQLMCEATAFSVRDLNYL